MSEWDDRNSVISGKRYEGDFCGMQCYEREKTQPQKFWR